jgi:hypothetical protein
VPTSNVCISENLTINDDGQLQMAQCAVPQCVIDQMIPSTADGALVETIYTPGKLLMNQQFSWRNDTPVNMTILIRVTRRYKRWIVSNPNAIQFRDRWSWAIDSDAAEPTTGGIFNSQCGSAGDIGTDTVAEPKPGKFYHWWGTSSSEEWVWLPVNVGQTINIWYRCYVWTPPPFSDNANKNQPQHVAEAGWTRFQVIAFPQQGALVFG